MAYLIKKPYSRYWYACFWAGGKQYRKTTKETSRTKAMAAARILEEIANHRIRPSFLRVTIANFARDFYGEDIKAASVREFASQWLEIKQPEVGVKTYACYKASVTKFLAFLGAVADHDIATIGKNTLLSYRGQLVKTIRASSVNHDMDLVRSIFKSAKENGYLLDDPCQFVSNVKRENARSPRRPFTVPELKSIIEVANDEWRSLIKFGLYTGQRLTDIASLRWSNIDLKNGVITFVTRKTGRSMTIPIAGPLEEHISSLPVGDDPDAPVHPRSLRRISVKSQTSGRLSNEFTDIMVSAGLRQLVIYPRHSTSPKGRKNTQSISFHSLRHTAVSLLKSAGIPQAVVQELIGHSSQKMSALYTHTGIDALRRAAEALPSL